MTDTTTDSDIHELSDEIVRRIRAIADPAKIILFGSAATGEMTAESDIDLLVVEHDIDDVRREAARLRHALRGIGKAFDIVVMRRDRFEETKAVIGGLAYPAHKYGAVIYEAA